MTKGRARLSSDLSLSSLLDPSASGLLSLLIPVDLPASADRTESCRRPRKAPPRSNVELPCEPPGSREIADFSGQPA